MINIDSRDTRPIWRQIELGLRDLIRLRRLEPGDAVPSVRQFARSQQVNPATVSKAYQSLTAAGYLEVRRGEGTFVAADPPRLDSRQRREHLRSAAARLVELAIGLKATEEDVAGVLAELWSERLEVTSNPQEKRHA